MPLLGYQAPALRAVADTLRLLTVAQIARQPGVIAVYRVTALYFDGRASSSVGTLKRIGSGAVLELVYGRALGSKPLLKTLPLSRCTGFAGALATCGFDKLPDQPNLPERASADLWLIERAAGSFVRSVIVAPALAAGAHRALVEAVQTHLPDVLRELP
jgi:hypothetical protein